MFIDDKMYQLRSNEARYNHLEAESDANLCAFQLISTAPPVAQIKRL